MNDATIKLIEQLAAKLGTTSEYLWSVLIRQAYISAITDLIYYAVIIITGILLWKVHKYFSVEREKWDDRNFYDHEDMLAVPLMVCTALTWVCVAIAGIVSVGTTISAFINPEYWAIKQILSALN
jgi:hypothetical protein